MRQRICLIVGAGPGVGMGVARKFGREGFTIVLIARGQQSLTEYVRLLAQESITAVGYAVDIADLAGFKTMLTQIEHEVGPAQVLIYNAAVLTVGGVLAIDPAQLLSDLTVNVVGITVAVQSVVPQMRAAGSGTVLITGGGLSLSPFHEWTSLGIGKAGARNLSYALFAELNPLGIHAATVTIRGTVAEDTPLSPANIAEKFWQLHLQPKGKWEAELMFPLAKANQTMATLALGNSLGRIRFTVNPKVIDGFFKNKQLMAACA